MSESKTLLAELVEQRDKLRAEDSAAIEAREAERGEFQARDKKSDEDVQAFVDAERSYTDAADVRARDIRTLTRRIREQKTLEKRRAAAAKASVPAGEYVTAEPLTYRRDNERDTSYFADLACLHSKAQAHMHRHTKNAAAERLERHAAEMAVEIPKIEAERERRARKEIEGSVETRLKPLVGDPFQRNPFGVEQRVTPSRTDGFGGYFVRELVAV